MVIIVEITDQKIRDGQGFLHLISTELGALFHSLFVDFNFNHFQQNWKRVLLHRKSQKLLMRSQVHSSRVRNHPTTTTNYNCMHACITKNKGMETPTSMSKGIIINLLKHPFVVQISGTRRNQRLRSYICTADANWSYLARWTFMLWHNKWRTARNPSNFCTLLYFKRIGRADKLTHN